MKKKHNEKFFKKEKRQMNLPLVICLSLITIAVLIVIMNSVSAIQIAEPEVTKDATPTDINIKNTGFNEITTITIEVTGAGSTTTTPVPMDVVFAIDSSGSMTTNDPTNLRITASQNFVDMMDSSRDTGGVVSWDTNIDFTYGLSSNFATLKTQIGNVDSSGGTNLNVGLNAAIAMLDPPTSSHAEIIIFLTDGQGTYTPNASGGPASIAWAKGYVIYSIGLGSGHNPAPLIDMATATGGQYYNSPSAANLQQIFDDIYSEITTSTIPHYVDVIEVTQSCIVDEGSYNIAPDSVSTVGGITTITWNNIGMINDGDPDLSDDEIVTLTFDAKSDCCGQNQEVDVYGSAVVNYDDKKGVYAGSVLIPQAYINVDCDITPPTTIKDHGPCVMYDPSNGIWYMKPCNPIHLYARDLIPLATGVQFLHYELWWDIDCNGIYDVKKLDVTAFDNDPNDLNPIVGEIDVELHIDQECCHKLVWYAVDNFNNQEIPHEQYYRMDGTPPTITKTHPDPCYFPINQTAGIIKVEGRIILEAEDGGTPPCISGVEDIYYGFWYNEKWYPADPFDEYCGNYNISMYKDGKWWYTYTRPIRFHEECKHILEYWAKDNVCNTGPTYKQTYWVNDCQDEVWIDDDFRFYTLGWWHTHFMKKQMALDWLGPWGTAYVYDGIYDEDISIDDVPCCDNTGITQMGEYGCFPISESAVIIGTETIKVPYVKIKYLEYMPNTNGAIIVEPNIFGTYLRCNKFRRDCVADAIGVNALGGSMVNARLNWWGAPDGPNGGIMDDGKIADGLGVKVLGNVFVEPWIGIHAEIKKPDIPPPDPLNPDPHKVVEVGTPITFDATGSWAYSYGECCQEPEELPLQYLWDFGDGMQSANKIAIHLFDQPGTYQVTLMVDSEGIPGLYANFMYDWAYVTIDVTTENTTLTCNADGGNLGGYETIVNEPLQFYGGAYGGNGEYTWHWNFGDQTGDNTEQNPVHIYTEPGIYTATLTVISDGETATDTAEVTVYDIDELFVTINDANTIAGIETMFTASIKGGTPPYIVSWDFGDGLTSQETNPIHIYNNPGEYTVTVTVTDEKQKTATDTAKITVEEENIVEEAEIKEIKAGLGIKAVIAAGESNCNWEITVEGTVFLGGKNSGTIYANTQETVKLPLTFAFGKVDIIVTANEIQKQYTAIALGPLFLNLQEI